MKAKTMKSGYNLETANKYIEENKPVCNLSTELEPQHNFVNGKPTGEIVAYKAWFTQEGVEPFVVKFDSKIKSPKYKKIYRAKDGNTKDSIN